VASSHRFTATAALSSGTRGGSFVTSIPSSQLYYYTRQWQADERLAVAELEAGDGRVFDNSTDAIRWLLSEDA